MKSVYHEHDSTGIVHLKRIIDILYAHVGPVPCDVNWN